MILALLLNWRTYAAVALLAVVAWGGWEKLRADGLAKDLAACQAEKAVLGLEIEEQNQAVRDMEEKSRAALQKARTARAQADAAAASARPEITRLEAREAAPTPAGAGCKEAFAEIRR